MEQSKSFTTGGILAPLLRFALPVLAALFLQTLYGAVDMLVVGRFAQALDVSAVSTGSWLMQLITAFVTGCRRKSAAGGRTGCRRQRRTVRLHGRGYYGADANAGGSHGALDANAAGGV